MLTDGSATVSVTVVRRPDCKVLDKVVRLWQGRQIRAQRLKKRGHVENSESLAWLLLGTVRSRIKGAEPADCGVASAPSSVSIAAVGAAPLAGDPATSTADRAVALDASSKIFWHSVARFCSSASMLRSMCPRSLRFTSCFGIASDDAVSLWLASPPLPLALTEIAGNLRRARFDPRG